MNEMRCNVKLLSMTENATELIYAAFRQCYYTGFVADEMWKKLQNNEIDKETQESFIQNIISSGHTSPIEHVQFTFAVEGISRSLSHQLVRHRIASHSQQSMRYVDLNDFNYIIPESIKNNTILNEEFINLINQIKNFYELATKTYKIKAEDARYILSQATETKVVMSFNCRSLINFFNERCCMRSQWEIRDMANQMLKICQDKVPSIFKYAGAKCESLGYCPEIKKFNCGRYKTLEEILENKRS